MKTTLNTCDVMKVTPSLESLRLIYLDLHKI